MEGISEVYQRTLGPLSLFKDRVDDKFKEKVSLERPTTPINDEIKRAPTVFSQLANYVRRRINIDDEELFMAIEDQESLVAVLLSEVSYIWPDLRTQADDPFLTEAQNRELQRRIIVHIVATCQILFQNYIRKLDVLNKRGVFSSPANIIRLKAQLASDASRFLDVRTVRRHILAEIKQGRPDVCDDASVYSLTFVEAKDPNLELKSHFSVADLIDASRPRVPSKKKQCTIVSEAVPLMMAEMPRLDQGKLRNITNVLPTAETKPIPLEMKQQERVQKELPSTDDRGSDGRKKTSQDDMLLERVRLKRSKSLVELLRRVNGELDELDDGCKTSRPERLPLWHGEYQSKESKRGANANLKSNCTDDSKQNINDDLKRLLLCENEITSEDDIPPLLLFLRSNAKTERRKEELEEQLRKLEEREKAQKEREKRVLAKHLHAQPTYVTKKMQTKFTVRTSDARLSNRNSLSSLTLSKHATVYNHLSNEIGAETLKNLDASLFLKEEMTDVFEEIMKTMPSDHLQLDADDHVESGPASGTMLMSDSSSILNGRKKICNKNLQQSGRLSDFQNDAPCQGSVDVHTSEQANRDLLSKSVGSWLTWWKGTVNSDDYMKYLSTQDTDYLGVIFHFYSSDDGEEDAEKVRMERERTLANDRKLMAMTSEKTKFQPGLWNVNSVLMGGLGQTPTIDPDNNHSPITSSTADKKSGEVGTKPGSFVRPKSQVTASKSESSEQTSDTNTVVADGSFNSEAQQRLEIVWTMLQMPESEKLDMTVKYSFDGYYQKLRDAINDWEAVAGLIVQREAVILQLEKFERVASDPVRLLGRGFRGSKQLSEERQREAYNLKISAIEVRLKATLDKIEKLYEDIVTYQGRPYRDKMACDRVEMLFWLQEERKNKLLEHDSKVKDLPPLPASLVSLHPINIGDHLTSQELECVE